MPTEFVYSICNWEMEKEVQVLAVIIFILAFSTLIIQVITSALFANIVQRWCYNVIGNILWIGIFYIKRYWTYYIANVICNPEHISWC